MGEVLEEESFGRVMGRPTGRLVGPLLLLNRGLVGGVGGVRTREHARSEGLP